MAKGTIYTTDDRFNTSPSTKEEFISYKNDGTYDYVVPRHVATSQGKLFTDDLNNILDTHRTSTSHIRVADTSEFFRQSFRYGTESSLWEVISNINGTISHLPNEQAVSMTIPQASGDKIIRQTSKYFVYAAGRSMRLSLAINFNPNQTNLRQRAGYFNDSNGFFFEFDENGFYVVRRTSASGSPIDTRVEQANWNQDNMDGTGASGKTLDMTKIQMLFIDWTWYGAGSVKYGIEIDNRLYWVHVTSAGNSLTEPILGSPHLPVRYEIENVGATSANSTMTKYGMHLGIDGSNEIDGFRRAFATGVITTNTVTNLPLLSIRPKLTVNSINNHAFIRAISIGVASGTGGGNFKIIKNATLTTPSWTDVDADDVSVVQYDTTATSLTGGIVVGAGVIATNKGGTEKFDIRTRDPLTINDDGTTADTLTIAITTSDNSTSLASINWIEVY